MRIQTASRPALLTYCTNVHAVDDAAALIRALDETTARVAAEAAPGEAFGLGLRLGEQETRELRSDPALLARLEELFARRRFFVFTINGFPQGRFQAGRVKGSVYLPDWADPARTRYTLDLAALLARWLPGDDRSGTISTLPIGWRADAAEKAPLAGRELRAVAAGLARLESETGARIMVCLEPEPGCVVESMPELVAFFERHLLSGPDELLVRRHLGACFDACHEAMLFHDPEAALRALGRAGILVGKVQVSNALRLDFEGPGGLDALIACDEERFLHQVAVAAPRGAAILRRYTDLPDLRRAVARGDLEGSGEARCHFHVPIHAESFPPLRTTRDELVRTLGAALRLSDVRHFEVETYTFHVLPGALRAAPLETQLVEELRFARRSLAGTR